MRKAVPISRKRSFVIVTGRMGLGEQSERSTESPPHIQSMKLCNARGVVVSQFME